MKKLGMIRHSNNIMSIECKDTISLAEVSAFISYGEILDVKEGDWRTEDVFFQKNDKECSFGTAQESLAALSKDWPDFYKCVKKYAPKDKLWTIQKAQAFAREREIFDLSKKIDDKIEELNILNKKRRRLQLPDPGKKGERHGKGE